MYTLEWLSCRKIHWSSASVFAPKASHFLSKWPDTSKNPWCPSYSHDFQFLQQLIAPITELVHLKVWQWRCFSALNQQTYRWSMGPKCSNLVTPLHKTFFLLTCSSQSYRPYLSSVLLILCIEMSSLLSLDHLASLWLYIAGFSLIKFIMILCFSSKPSKLFWYNIF